jgi:hypothetical protein
MLKPFVVDAPPPRAYGNLVFVPLVAVALWFSLPSRDDAEENVQAYPTGGADGAVTKSTMTSTIPSASAWPSSA